MLNADSLRDATEADHRTATREGCLKLLEQVAAVHGGPRLPLEAAIIANAVRALLAVPQEVTSTSLAIGTRLLATTIDVVVSRALPLEDGHLRVLAQALDAGIDVAAARLREYFRNSNQLPPKVLPRTCDTPNRRNWLQPLLTSVRSNLYSGRPQCYERGAGGGKCERSDAAAAGGEGGR